MADFSTGIAIGIAVGVLLGSGITSLIHYKGLRVWRKWRSRITIPGFTSDPPATHIESINIEQDKVHYYSGVKDDNRNEIIGISNINYERDDAILPPRPPKRYEDCIVEHKYSTIPKPSADPYEFVDVHGSNGQDTVDENASHNIYNILEPGSNRRLPVTMLSLEEKHLKPDPNQIYFVLEPGSNKVKPLIPDNFATLKRVDNHVYFVLDPATTEFDDCNAYAVSDLEDVYFFLERIDSPY